MSVRKTARCTTHPLVHHTHLFNFDVPLQFMCTVWLAELYCAQFFQKIDFSLFFLPPGLRRSSACDTVGAIKWTISENNRANLESETSSLVRRKVSFFLDCAHINIQQDYSNWLQSRFHPRTLYNTARFYTVYCSFCRWRGSSELSLLTTMFI